MYLTTLILLPLSLVSLQVLQKARDPHDQRGLWRPSHTLFFLATKTRHAFWTLGQAFGYLGNLVNLLIDLVDFRLLRDALYEMVEPLVLFLVSPYQMVAGYIAYLKDFAWRYISVIGCFFGLVVIVINLGLRFYSSLDEPTLYQTHLITGCIFVLGSLYVRMRIMLHKRSQDDQRNPRTKKDGSSRWTPPALESPPFQTTKSW